MYSGWKCVKVLKCVCVLFRCGSRTCSVHASHTSPFPRAPVFSVVVGSLPFLHSGAGECLLVLLVVVGWPLHVVTSWTKMTNNQLNSSFIIWLPCCPWRHGTWYSCQRWSSKAETHQISCLDKRQHSSLLFVIVSLPPSIKWAGACVLVVGTIHFGRWWPLLVVWHRCHGLCSCCCSSPWWALTNGGGSEDNGWWWKGKNVVFVC